MSLPITQTPSRHTNLGLESSKDNNDNKIMFVGLFVCLKLQLSLQTCNSVWASNIWLLHWTGHCLERVILNHVVARARALMSSDLGFSSGSDAEKWHALKVNHFFVQAFVYSFTERRQYFCPGIVRSIKLNQFSQLAQSLAWHAI